MKEVLQIWTWIYKKRLYYPFPSSETNENFKMIFIKSYDLKKKLLFPLQSQPVIQISYAFAHSTKGSIASHISFRFKLLFCHQKSSVVYLLDWSNSLGLLKVIHLYSHFWHISRQTLPSHPLVMENRPRCWTCFVAKLVILTTIFRWRLLILHPLHHGSGDKYLVVGCVVAAFSVLPTNEEIKLPLFIDIGGGGSGGNNNKSYERKNMFQIEFLTS